LSHFTSLGQGMTIATGNGIFEDRGNLKSWALQLFKRLAKERTAKLCVITNRQVQERELTSLPNVIQCAVPPLPDGEIRTIMIATAPAFGAKPEPPSDLTIRSIGGHPGIAKSATRLIAQKGLWVFEQNPRDLIDYFGDNLDVLCEKIKDESARHHQSRNGGADENQPPQLDRLLDPAIPSVTLDTLRRAASAVGRTLRVELT
jgi:hypothetical protein